MISKGWLAALASALALMALGAYLGEPGRVFLHAVSVCLACLGVG